MYINCNQFVTFCQVLFCSPALPFAVLSLAPLRTGIRPPYSLRFATDGHPPAVLAPLRYGRASARRTRSASLSSGKSSGSEHVGALPQTPHSALARGCVIFPPPQGVSVPAKTQSVKGCPTAYRYACPLTLFS